MGPPADCLFCLIIAGRTPGHLVWQSEHAVALRDINPQAPTHLLVLPRQHHRDVAALAADDPDALVGLLRGIGEVAAAQEDLRNGYRVVFNTGAEAGQSVFHCHAHVLGGRAMTWPPG
jgi:histidine triad (HIT) family protein